MRACAPLLLAALAIALPGCGILKKEEKELPPAELTKFEPEFRLRRVWSANAGDGTESLRLGLAPVTDGSRIFVATHDGRISAYDAETGRRQWQTKTKLAVAGGPGTDGEYVVAGSANGELVALGGFDGDEVWRTTVSSEVLSAPALGENLVFVLTVDGRLHALSRPDGSTVWTTRQAVPRLSVRGSGAPIVVRGTVVCGFDNGRVAAYRAIDGEPVWDVLLAPPSGRNEVERLVDINAPVRAIGQELYAVSYQGRLASLALESGQVLWSQDVASYTGLAADAASVYVSTPEGELVGVNRATGDILWRTDLLARRALSGPAAWQASVAVGDFEGYLHVFSAGTGTLQARARADRSRIVAPPLVVNDMLFVLSEDGEISAWRQEPLR